MNKVHATEAQEVKKKTIYDTSEALNAEGELFKERDRAANTSALGFFDRSKLSFRRVIFNEMALDGDYPLRSIKLASSTSLLISLVGLGIAIWAALDSMPVVLTVSLFLFNLIYLVTATIISASSSSLSLFFLYFFLI